MIIISCMYKLSQNLLPRLLFKSQRIVTFFLPAGRKRKSNTHWNTLSLDISVSVVLPARLEARAYYPSEILIFDDTSAIILAISAPPIETSRISGAYIRTVSL